MRPLSSIARQTKDVPPETTRLRGCGKVIRLQPASFLSQLTLTMRWLKVTDKKGKLLHPPGSCLGSSQSDGATAHMVNLMP
jgi:hypothetical protein